METKITLPQVGYKGGIGWCVWVDDEMLAAGFMDQHYAKQWANNLPSNIDIIVADIKAHKNAQSLHKVESSSSLCGND